MALPRKRALERLNSLAPLVAAHLANIEASPTDLAVSHWQREIRNWLTQMEAMLSHVGKKTAAEWHERIQGYRDALGSERAPTDLEKILAAVYNQVQHLDDRAANARARRNFVFHMTECANSLLRLGELLQEPRKFDRDTARQTVVGFLYHAIPHLRAAGRLALDYTPEDIFAEVDLTSG